MITQWLLVGIVMLCNCCSDLMNTAGMRRHGKVEDLSPNGLMRLIRKLARNRYVIGGFIANAAGFFTLMALLSVANVSFAIPATAGSFVLETALAKLLLKEDVHWQRWLGSSVIACGVALLTLP